MFFYLFIPRHFKNLSLDPYQVDQGRTEGASVETSPVLKVKYLTYKNMASIAKEQGDFSAALEAYIQVRLCAPWVQLLRAFL